MTAIDEWYASEKRSFDRIVGLEEALLFERQSAYLWYRLRFLVLRLAFHTLSHLVELFLFLEFLNRRELSTFLFLIVAFGLCHGFWWGALESLRDKARTLSREGNGRSIPRLVQPYIQLGILLSLVTLVGGGAGLLLILALGISFSNFSLVLIVLYLVRLAIQFPVQAHYAAVYAIRRIYRPIASIVAVDLIGFLLVVSLYPVAGHWVFPIVIAISTLVGTWLTLHFTSEMRAILGWEPVREFPLFDRPRSLARDIHSKLFYWGGFAGATLRFDAIVILVAGIAHFRGAEITPYILLYSISPQVHASHDWSQIFYFDFKKLELDLFSNFHTRFLRTIRRVSVALALLTWMFALLTLKVFFTDLSAIVLWSLFPFFLIRSFLSVEQITQFVQFRYSSLILSGVVFTGVFAAGMWISTNLVEVLLSITFAAGGAWLSLSYVPSTSMRRSEGMAILPSEFFSRLSDDSRGPGILLASFRWQDGFQSLSDMLESVCEEIGDSGFISLWGRNSLLLWSPTGLDPESLSKTLVRESGGSLLELREVKQVNGRWNPGDFGLDFAVGGDGEREELLKKVQEIWPSAVFVSVEPSEGTVRLPTELESKLPRFGLLRDAAYFAKRLSFRPTRSEWFVATICRKSAIEGLVFLEASEDWDANFRNLQRVEKTIQSFELQRRSDYGF
ncbi:MAG: hypothetical protein KDD64_07520 [Bdellovibrionales bacterium]|nr:hypothetical protein [Bdellovibrionales bacterium]